MQTNPLKTPAVPPAPTFVERGFTLTELAIVMFIVALLLGGMLLPLSAQQDVRAQQETEKTQSDIRDALLGFAMANDRLPCPASSTSNGVESYCDSASGACVVTAPPQYRSHGRCSNPYDGFVPAVTLGLSAVDSQGYLLDGWGDESIHRVRYAVSTNSPSSNENYPPHQTDFSSPSEAFAFTYSGGMKAVTMSSLKPNLKTCNTGTGIQNSGSRLAACATSPTDTSLATDVVAVIYSLGKNAVTGGTSDDEKHNPNSQPVPLVAADPAFVNAPQGAAFDDQIIWLSKNTLFNRMVAAGKLP